MSLTECPITACNPEPGQGGLNWDQGICSSISDGAGAYPHPKAGMANSAGMSSYSAEPKKYLCHKHKSSKERLKEN